MPARSHPGSALPPLPVTRQFAFPVKVRKFPIAPLPEGGTIEVTGLRMPPLVVSTAVAALLLGLVLAFN